MMFYLLWKVGLSMVALLPCYRAPGSDDQCESGTCSADLRSEDEVPRTKIVTVATIGHDDRRVHLSYLHPERVRSEAISTTSTISDAVVLPIAEDFVALVVLTYDGKVAWYRGNPKAKGARTPLQSMGSVHSDLPPASCLGAGNGKALAVGHQDGSASIWDFIDNTWTSRVTMQSSHHEWEQVTRVAISRDGSVAVVCTADNIGLFRFGSSTTPPKELKHLHGGDSQVSSAHIADLAEGGYLVTVGFQNGGFQGWEVLPEGENVEILWQLPRRGLPRITAITVGGPGVVATDSDGKLSFWPLDSESLEIAPNQNPKWTAKPSASFSAAAIAWVSAAQSFDPDESEQIVLALSNEVVILDGETGWEVKRIAEPGSPAALSTH